MIDNEKSKKQLIEELKGLRQQVVELKNGSAEKSNSDTTDSKRAGEAPCTCTKAIETVLDAVSTVAVQSYDENGTICYWNKANEEVYGYTAEEALGKNIVDLIIPPEMRAFVREVIRKGAETGIMPPPSEMLLMRKDGSRVPVHSSHPVIRFPDGTVRMYCVDVNLSVLKNTEEQLHTIFKTAKDSIFIKDLDMQYISINPAMEYLFGLSSTDIIGKTDNELFGPEAGAHIKEVDSRVLNGETIEEEHTKPVRGQEYTFHIIKVPIRNAVGEIIGICGIARDISERKQSEKALRESEEKYRLIFETAANLIMSVNSEGTFVDCNNRIESILAYTREEMIGQNITKIIHPDYHPKVQKLLAELIVTGTAQSKVSKMVRKDGRLIDVCINSSAITDKQGNFVCSICIIQDVTETKRLQKLESRADRLETAGTIAGQVAHDFNTLLAPIIIYPEFIREELLHDSKAQSYLYDIEKAGKKIADINQDLLTLSRRGYYKKEILDLNEIVQHVIKEIKFRTSVVTYNIELCKDLMSIKGGSAQIHRIITNLLVNAVDAMQDIGLITIKTENYYADDTTIDYDRIPKGEYVKLTVTDTGCGIPAEIIQKILDPFFTTKTTDKIRGSGLGLSVVNSVMKDHDGYINISSTIGQGASFYLYFPVTRANIGEGDSIKSTIVDGHEKIMVIDDDKIQQDVSAVVLGRLGYEVTTVSSGEEAIEFLKGNPQDLLILDMIMPSGIDGAETYKRILEIYPEQKAILVSGFSESDRVSEAQRRGAGAFIKKPLTMSTIAVAVRTELDREEKDVTV